MAFGVIYLITNLLNGMKYVGQTINLKRRISQHKRENLYVDRAIKKYGWENFTIEVLEECDSFEQLNEREKFWIAELNCMYPEGYNFTEGGKNGSPNDETRAKMSAAKTGAKNHLFGKHLPTEQRAKMSIAMTGEKNHRFGTHLTDEQRARLSEINSGENNANFGKKAPDEVRSKLSISHRGETHFKNLQKELDNRKLSHTALAGLMGLSQSAISAKMRGNQNFTAEQVAKLVEIFSKPADYLMQRDDE